MKIFFVFHLLGSGSGKDAIQLLKNQSWIITKIETMDMACLLEDYKQCAEELGSDPLLESIVRALHLLAPVLEKPTNLNLELRRRMIWEYLWNRLRDVPTFDQHFRMLIHGANSSRKFPTVGFNAKWPLLAGAHVSIFRII